MIMRGLGGQRASASESQFKQNVMGKHLFILGKENAGLIKSAL